MHDLSLLFRGDPEFVVRPIVDPRFQDRQHLGGALADSGEDDALARATRRQRPVQFAARGHIAASAVFDHEPGQVSIGVGFDAVADERLDGGERGLQLLEVMRQRFLAVDVERRAVLLGKRRHGNVVTVEDAVAVGEVVHLDS